MVGGAPRQVRSSGIRLDELRYNSCRYIISEVAALSVRYCGHNRQRGSYCTLHAELCYLPPKSKQHVVANLELA
jgi:hypothetical protein